MASFPYSPSLQDRLRWKEHEKVSMEQEAEREFLEQEDEIDEKFIEHLMATTPGLVSPRARYGTTLWWHRA